MTSAHSSELIAILRRGLSVAAVQDAIAVARRLQNEAPENAGVLFAFKCGMMRIQYWLDDQTDAEDIGNRGDWLIKPAQDLLDRQDWESLKSYSEVIDQITG